MATIYIAFTSIYSYLYNISIVLSVYLDYMGGYMQVICTYCTILYMRLEHPRIFGTRQDLEGLCFVLSKESLNPFGLACKLAFNGNVVLDCGLWCVCVCETTIQYYISIKKLHFYSGNW